MVRQWAACRISIHALREEGDSLPKAVVKDREEFLSTPSARRATCSIGSTYQRTKFLSTPSARRATPYRFVDVSRWQDFYPRPPRGGRPPTPKLLSRRRYFYPRPPRGGRLLHGLPQGRAQKISIHALREEGDQDQNDLRKLNVQFLSTPSARRATDLYRFIADFGVISIHALREEGDNKPEE